MDFGSVTSAIKGYGSYGTFAPQTPKQIAMKTLSGESGYDQSVKAAINEVFKSGSNADKKDLVQHLFNCIRNQQLPETIRKDYEAIVQKLPLTNLDLQGLHLSGLNCEGMRLNFRGSNLTGADFSKVTLASLCLDNTTSVQLNLTNLTCNCLTIDNADATNAILSRVKVNLFNLFDSTLTGIDLTNADVGTLGLTTRKPGVRIDMTKAKLDGFKLGHQSYLRAVDIT